jgi:hypothetical protein
MMHILPDLRGRRERGAALIIVLAFVVLLTGVVVAYFSRATSDRPVAQSSVHQTKADQVAASGMDLVIGGLRQEITGPVPTPTPPYVPATNARILPVTFGNPDPPGIPNLVRRSVTGDASAIPAPAVASFASAINSAPADPANPKRGDVTLARWNKHYLVPKANTGNDQTDPVASFLAPDWVILTRNGAVAFPGWNDLLKDSTPTNNSYAVGRYAYAIYDEGSLLDANVVGYPTDPSAAPIPAQRIGRKGPVVFADLTTLPYPIPQSQTDKIVGWRNYGSIQGTAAFGTFPNFTFTAPFATNYFNNFVSLNTTGFSTTNGLVASNGRTDQGFLSRQELIAFRAATQFSSNALQYLTTFGREFNSPSWKPSTPTGSSIDYAALANTATSVNRDLLNVRVPGSNPATAAFTRADGTTAFQTDLLIKQRFPLSRITGLADPTFAATTKSTINNGYLVPATAATVQRDFGLKWNSDHWDYVGATGTTVQTAIKTLDQVATDNREPNFFELLKAGILSGSVGMGSSGRTFVAPEARYYSIVAPTAADYQIIQIGANIIDQWDSDNIPTFINFGGNEIAGVENLPYLNKLVFKPAWIKVSGKDQFAAWLLPSLWNPNQNAPPASQSLRIAMPNTTQSMTATLTDSGTPLFITTPTAVPGKARQFMTIDATNFGTSPQGVTTANPDSQSNIDKSNPENYYGFRFTFATVTTVTPTNSLTAYPDFGAAGCDFELQVQVNGNWKAYQRWTACGPAHPLIFQPPASSYFSQTNLQDPEFVTLDPRTVRFGVWGNQASHTGASPSDFTSGVGTGLQVAAGTYEGVTDLPPVGANFSSSTSTNKYLYERNDDGTVHYTDPDTIQRRGDSISGSTTPMLPANFSDRPQILNRPFQSLAELGQVFRDQPWKTLDFTTASSPDVGLLDVFSLHESTNEGGKTSLNTRYKPVLTAILSNAIKRLSGTAGDVISSTERDNIVTALYNITSTNPMIRKTDLLAQLANDASVASLGSKEARELVMRAFSDATQTRTWNLMIDLIAQSGRYPPNASTLAGFLVEGEQHYWVHVAIDRFTGQVVDKQIEVVNE